jgi:hypothetical protein
VQATLDSFSIGGLPINVVALSPSPQDVLRALESFAGYFVSVDQPATGLSPIDPNHSSVVLSIQIGNEYLLLGGDLEVTASHLTGWNAVLASKNRPQQLSIFFKVPHHGSSNAQSADVWRSMLTNPCTAVVTSYTRSGVPRVSEVDWLRSRAGVQLFTTGLPKGVRVRRRSEVDKTVKEATRNFNSYQLSAQPNVVRFRKPLGAQQEWAVETFGDARQLD